MTLTKDAFKKKFREFTSRFYNRVIKNLDKKDMDAIELSFKNNYKDVKYKASVRTYIFRFENNRIKAKDIVSILNEEQKENEPFMKFLGITKNDIKNN